MRFGDLSLYVKNSFLGHVVGKVDFVMPVSHIGLSTTDPETVVTEPTDAAYDRVTTAGSDWEAPADGRISNAAEILFPTPGEDWGTIPYWFAADNGVPGAGNVLFYGRLGFMSTRLDEQLAYDDTTITVLSTSLMPSSGTIIIEDEEITYSGKGATTLTGCTRAANGTIAKAHATGHEIFSCSPKTIGVDDTVRFSVGKLKIRADYSTTSSIIESLSPSLSPSASPSYSPSASPSYSPSASPSYSPSLSPSLSPSYSPSLSPSYSPSLSPSYSPSPST